VERAGTPFIVDGGEGAFFKIWQLFNKALVSFAWVIFFPALVGGALVLLNVG
jgi:hypothetical protein